MAGDSDACLRWILIFDDLKGNVQTPAERMS